MNILGHGIDLVSLSRFEEVLERQGSAFEKRYFSSAEIAYCRQKPHPHKHFAARFAAKEAYGKALGLGIGASGEMVEVEVVLDEKGAPSLKLSGRAREIFTKAGGKEIFVSLSHDGDMAMASVILTN